MAQIFTIKQHIDPDMLAYLRKQMGEDLETPSKKKTGKA